MAASVEVEMQSGDNLVAHRTRALFSNVFGFKVTTRPHGRLRVVVEWDKKKRKKDFPGPHWVREFIGSTAHVLIRFPDGTSKDECPFLVYKVASENFELITEEKGEPVSKRLAFELIPESDRAVKHMSTIADHRVHGRGQAEILSLNLVMAGNVKIILRTRDVSEEIFSV